MLSAKIRVYACSGLETSKYNEKGYYKIEGRMGGLTREWVSDIKLEAGLEPEVNVKLSEYKGAISLLIVSLE